MAKSPFNSSGPDGVKPSGSSALPISSHVAKQNLCSALLLRRGRMLQELLSCPAVRHQDNCLSSSQAPARLGNPYKNPLEGHLKVV